jgi:CBS domain-containing protein
MQARDIMTTNVIAVSPDTPVSRVASLLLENRISAVPVIDHDRQVVGIVSEGDLMHRRETGTGRPRSWWLEFAADTETLARDYAKTHGRRAVDVMTRHVVSVTEDADAATIASLLDSHGIKRVPVVRHGKLAGIVSRADLLRALASAPPPAGPPAAADDRTLHDAILRKMRAEPWSQDVMVNVVVSGGEVELWGFVASDQQRAALRVLAENVPGVRAVRDQLRAMPRWAHAE